ncbi:MAG: hypothetical protein MI810_11015 [Flavobacteriales bacterium]|nr:hypothetical protein [Flavobacteriales bacterium]
MSKKIGILICVLWSCSLWAQEVKFGITTGTHLFYRISLKDAFYFPENSFTGYQESSAGTGVINKNSMANSFFLGSTINGSYKRWTATLEPQYFYQRTTLRFTKPISVNRVFGKKAFRLPVYISYKLWKKENSTYLFGGLIFHKETNYDFQSPGTEVYFNGVEFGQNSIDYGDNHFYRALYTEKGYWSYTFGIGKITRRGVNYGVRFHRRLNLESRGIMADIFNVEFMINLNVVSTKDFTKKHFLYVD